MKILSWNVAGLRAMFKKENLNNLLQEEENNYDIVCLQETKVEEKDVKLPEFIVEKYPFRYWNSSKGTTQRKGFSGTTIWSKTEPKNITYPDFDEEGRIIILDFDEFTIINIYVPNSQKFENDRYYFRQKWNSNFYELIKSLSDKNLIICGDFNVAHLDIDINNPKQKKNRIAGFFDFERLDFAYLIENLNLIDVFRQLNPIKKKSTYWSYFLKKDRNNENGWRIDYFLISKSLFEKEDKNIKYEILMQILGSDHCPLVLELL